MSMGKLLECMNQEIVIYFLFECWWKAPQDVQRVCAVTQISFQTEIILKAYSQ